MEVKKNEIQATVSHDKNRGTGELIMGLMLVIFLGYLMMWVLMPTHVYRQHWNAKIKAHTNSTYFGTQGSRILLFTFPILFIAVLGSVCLHLGMKVGHGNCIKRKYVPNSWKRPMVIKGLGIVCLQELFFLIMFIALLVWTFSMYLHIFFRDVSSFKPKTGEKMWETKLEIIALVLGIVGNVCLTFLFFPVTRGSSLLPLFGLTSEASIKYHIWLGHIVMSVLTAHGLLYIIYRVVTGRPEKMLEWSKTHISNFAGELSLLFGLILWVTTYPSIRRKMFELFFYTHYLYILFIIFFVLHVGISYSCLMLPGFYLFLVDRYLRFLQSRQRVQLLSARLLSCETVELNFSKSQGLSYAPTSVLFINIPSISKLQWHPYTISSSSNLEPEILSVIIKKEGCWSKKLFQTLAKSSSSDHLDVSVEGPHGPASTDFLRHDKLVMVSGGSGIFPFISIIRELIFVNSTMKCKAPDILLICAFKTFSDLAMLDLILPLSDATYGNSNIELQIEAHVTRERRQPPENSKSSQQTVWFKTRMSDASISLTLGKYSWLWLGAIISSSFILFLLLLGILTRFYIYPIDHNTHKLFSNSVRAVLNMLLVCISIVIAASATFLWNKKQSPEGTIGLPHKSQNSWSSNAVGIELESCPQGSLLKATKVHYGQRPNLRRMLLEHKESSVGVLVSGPKSMRYDVANICSTPQAHSLHFKAISFSW